MNHGLIASALSLEARTLHPEGPCAHRDRRDAIRCDTQWRKHKLRKAGGAPRVKRATAQGTDDGRGAGTGQKISARNG